MADGNSTEISPLWYAAGSLLLIVAIAAFLIPRRRYTRATRITEPAMARASSGQSAIVRPAGRVP